MLNSRRRGAEGPQIGEGLLRLRGGVDDRALVTAQDIEPMPDITCMTFMKDVGQAEIRATEPGADLGDQFLEGVGIVAKALAERAGKPIGVA